MIDGYVACGVRTEKEYMGCNHMGIMMGSDGIYIYIYIYTIQPLRHTIILHHYIYRERDIEGEFTHPPIPINTSSTLYLMNIYTVWGILSVP